MKRCFDFLGPEVSGTGRDRVYVVPVPIELSTSYGKGTAFAPEAILKASLQIEIYNSEIDLDLANAGIITLRSKIENREDLISFLGENREMLLSAFPCFIGGEHSITPWILDGLCAGDVGIVWLDAHADLRVSYQGESDSHACAARNSLAYGTIVEIGVRSYSKEENDFIAGSPHVSIFRRWNEGAREAVRNLPRNIYLSLDYDVLDPSILRAVGTPEPDGLMWSELMQVLAFLFSEKNVIAMDAVELCPMGGDEASNFIGAKAIYEALSLRLKQGG